MNEYKPQYLLMNMPCKKCNNAVILQIEYANTHTHTHTYTHIQTQTQKHRVTRINSPSIANVV